MSIYKLMQKILRMSKLINKQCITAGNMNKITARSAENSALLHMLLLVVFKWHRCKLWVTLFISYLSGSLKETVTY